MFKKFIKIANMLDNMGLVSEADIIDSIFQSLITKSAASVLTTYNGVDFAIGNSIISQMHESEFGMPEKNNFLGFSGDMVYYHVKGLEYGGQNYDNHIVGFNYKTYSNNKQFDNVTIIPFSASFRGKLDGSVDIEHIANNKSDLDVGSTLGLPAERDVSFDENFKEKMDCFGDSLKKIEKIVENYHSGFIDAVKNSNNPIVTFADTVLQNLGIDTSIPPKGTPEDFLEEYDVGEFAKYENKFFITDDPKSVHIAFKGGDAGITEALGAEGFDAYPKKKGFVFVFKDHAVVFVTGLAQERTAKLIIDRLNLLSNDSYSSADFLSLFNIMETLRDCGLFSSSLKIRKIDSATLPGKTPEQIAKELEEKRRKELEGQEGKGPKPGDSEPSVPTPTSTVVLKYQFAFQGEDTKDVTVPKMFKHEEHTNPQQQEFNFSINGRSIVLRVYSDDGSHEEVYDISTPYYLYKFFKVFKEPNDSMKATRFVGYKQSKDAFSFFDNGQNFSEIFGGSDRSNILKLSSLNFEGVKTPEHQFGEVSVVENKRLIDCVSISLMGNDFFDFALNDLGATPGSGDRLPTESNVKNLLPEKL